MGAVTSYIAWVLTRGDVARRKLISAWFLASLISLILFPFFFSPLFRTSREIHWDCTKPMEKREDQVAPIFGGKFERADHVGSAQLLDYVFNEGTASVQVTICKEGTQEAFFLRNLIKTVLYNYFPFYSKAFISSTEKERYCKVFSKSHKVSLNSTYSIGVEC